MSDTQTGYQPQKSDPVRPSVRLITVCDSCLCASCWQGEFYCENYRSAGTRELPLQELQERALEHPDYWEKYR